MFFVQRSGNQFHVAHCVLLYVCLQPLLLMILSLPAAAAATAVVSPPAAVTQSGGRGQGVNLQQWRLQWEQLQYLLLWHSSLQGIECLEKTVQRWQNVSIAR